jgi:hypothetical protein
MEIVLMYPIVQRMAREDGLGLRSSRNDQKFYGGRHFPPTAFSGELDLLPMNSLSRLSK